MRWREIETYFPVERETCACNSKAKTKEKDIHRRTTQIEVVTEKYFRRLLPSVFIDSDRRLPESMSFRTELQFFSIKQ